MPSYVRSRGATSAPGDLACTYWLVQLLLSLLFAAGLSYAWLAGHLRLQRERLELLPLIAAVEEAQQEQARLQLQVDRFEHPLALSKRLVDPRFRHLHFPRLNEVSWLPLQSPSSPAEVSGSTLAGR